MVISVKFGTWSETWARGQSPGQRSSLRPPLSACDTGHATLQPQEQISPLQKAGNPISCKCSELPREPEEEGAGGGVAVWRNCDVDSPLHKGDKTHLLSGQMLVPQTCRRRGQ